MIYLLLGLFLGTVGLAWMHEIVHKWKLFNISICWKYHLLHHGKNDPELELKRNNDIISYSLKRLLIYMNVRKWRWLDFLTLGLCIYNPMLFLTVFSALFIVCNIEYLQHDYNNYPVDFCNKFDNFIGLNFGKHTKHHGYNQVKHEVDTEFYVGFFAMYIWFFVCLLFYPILLINPKKPNEPGIYKYGLLQNISNYKASNGNSFRKLLYRMPSIFDKPKILIQYIRLMFGFSNKTELPELTHDVSNIRNIYLFKELPLDGITFNNGKVTEGHHRYIALIRGGSETE